jgi:hypothetical protein
MFISKSIIWTIVSIGLVVVVAMTCAIQGELYVTDLRNSRDDSLLEWSKSNEVRKLQVYEYFSLCRHDGVTLARLTEEFKTVYDCVQSIGGKEMLGAYKKADDTVEKPFTLMWSS